MSFDFPKREKPSTGNRWLISFADLLSLILTFFVMLYSMTDPILITKKPTNDNNSFVEFKDSGKNAKIDIMNQPGVIDTGYLESVIRYKIANDDNMRRLNVRIIDGRLTIYAHKDIFTDQTIRALYDTISSLQGETGVVAADLQTAYDVALKFNKLGMTDNLSYFEDNDLQNNVKILVYSKF